MTNDITGAVKEAKQGRIDFRVDSTSIVHVGLGKVRCFSPNFGSTSELQFARMTVFCGTLYYNKYKLFIGKLFRRGFT